MLPSLLPYTKVNVWRLTHTPMTSRLLTISSLSGVVGDTLPEGRFLITLSGPSTLYLIVPMC